MVGTTRTTKLVSVILWKLVLTAELYWENIEILNSTVTMVFCFILNLLMIPLGGAFLLQGGGAVVCAPRSAPAYRFDYDIYISEGVTSKVWLLSANKHM